MLLDAARRGAREIIIGLGGSATNDGGLGMARALGFRFFDVGGTELGSTVTELMRLERIGLPDELHLPRIVAAVDVQNPLLGPTGSTRVFGPQKGAAATQIETLEAALAQLADVVERDFRIDCRHLAGSGAAGGLGFGLVAFCRAEIRSGFEVVAEHVGLEAAIGAADIVITGEGRLDAQTLLGKAPAGVAQLARKLGKPCYAVVGEYEPAAHAEEFLTGVLAAKPAHMSRADAMKNARALVRECGQQLATSLRQALPDA
jgi:glycerate kinase